jgi:hypothetical protein
VINDVPSLLAALLGPAPVEKPAGKEQPPHDRCHQAPPYAEQFKQKFYVASGNHDAFGHDKYSHDTGRRTFEHFNRVMHTTQPRRRDLAYGRNTWNSSLKL